MKKVEFLCECIDDEYEPHRSIKPSSSSLPLITTHEFKNEKLEKTNKTAGQDQKLERKELIESITSNKDFFVTLSKENSKENLEKLFPKAAYTRKKENNSENEKNKGDMNENKKDENRNMTENKKERIKSFLPKPSSYIEEYLKKEEKSEKKNVQPPMTAKKEVGKEENTDKIQKILETELGNLIGFFNYEEESAFSHEIFEMLVTKSQ